MSHDLMVMFEHLIFEWSVTAPDCQPHLAVRSRAGLWSQSPAFNAIPTNDLIGVPMDSTASLIPSLLAVLRFSALLVNHVNMSLDETLRRPNDRTTGLVTDTVGDCHSGGHFSLLSSYSWAESGPGSGGGEVRPIYSHLNLCVVRCVSPVSYWPFSSSKANSLCKSGAQV